MNRVKFPQKGFFQKIKNFAAIALVLVLRQHEQTIDFVAAHARRGDKLPVFADQIYLTVGNCRADGIVVMLVLEALSL